MASLSPVMVFPPASLVLVSWGCVWGLAKATAHLSGIVLLSSDPYVKVMGSLISHVCKYTDMYQFQYIVSSVPIGCLTQILPPIVFGLVSDVIFWWLMLPGCFWRFPVCPSPCWLTGVKLSVVITKACRMFLHSVTQTQLQVVWFLIINMFFSLNIVFLLGISDNSVSVYSVHHPNDRRKQPLLASICRIYFACWKKPQISDIHICPTCRGQR